MKKQEFEIIFAKVYPDFTRKLVHKVDELTPTEIKICMLIKMSFSNSQILDHLKISNNTLANTRSSIRKKFELDRSQSLTNSIICL
jgi:AraC family chitin signaling transcriptional activator